MQADKIKQVVIETIETSLELQLRAIRRMKGGDDQGTRSSKKSRKKASVNCRHIRKNTD